MQSLETSRKKELEKLKKAIVPILKKNDVVQAGIFGSFARGEAKKRSDVDILVKFNAKAKKACLTLSGQSGKLASALEEKWILWSMT